MIAEFVILNKIDGYELNDLKLEKDHEPVE